MAKMPQYDVTEIEQTLIDRIPQLVAERDLFVILVGLKSSYQNKEYADCLSALMIIEKYLFRGYELNTFVDPEELPALDFEAYFFDDEFHAQVIKDAISKKDSAQARQDFLDGVELIRAGDADASYWRFRASAVAGNPDGAYNYAICLARGEGCTPNLLMSAFWYWFAATHGNVKAMFNLAICFRHGTGVAADGMTALYWYIMAGLNGDAESIATVGIMLSNGEGIPSAEHLGEEILEAYAQSDLGKALLNLRAIKAALEPYIYNR